MLFLVWFSIYLSANSSETTPDQSVSSRSEILGNVEVEIFTCEKPFLSPIPGGVVSMHQLACRPHP